MKRCYAMTAAACVAAALIGGCSSNAPATKGLAKLQVNWLDSAFGVEKAPVFGWQMVAGRRGAAQSSYRLVVAKDAELKNVVWDSGKVASSLSAAIPYSGPALEASTRYWWAVEIVDETGATVKSVPSFFETGLFGDNAWANSKFIMPKPLDPEQDKKERPAFGVRKIIQNAKDVASAKWYVTGFGVFEAYVNGHRVSNLDANGKELFDELKPGFTHAFKTRNYFTYDITHLFNLGEKQSNILAAIVTRGWWNDQITGWRGKNSGFRAVLKVNYADGTTATLGTDESWDAGFDGAVRFADIHSGEDYDARISQAWLFGEPLSAKWDKAVANDEFKGVITPLIGPAIRVRNDLDLRPAEIYIVDKVTEANDQQYGIANIARRYTDGQKIELKPGEHLIVDFGQNSAGWESFQVSGGEGTKLNIRHSEFLNDGKGLKSRGNDGAEGLPYYNNLRKARAATNYTLSGKGVESFEPIFTFYGYRYIDVTTTAPVEFLKIRSKVVTSVLEGTDTANLATGDKDVNRLIKNCTWGHYSNYLSVPTDCPQRNERLGWTADTQVFTAAAAYDAQSYGFLCKFMADMRDSQGEKGAKGEKGIDCEGGYPGVAPFAQYGNNLGCVGWADAGVIVPYNMWKAYGDTTIIRDNFASMNKYMDWVDRNEGPSPHWGDWLAYNPPEHPQKWDYQLFLCGAFYVWDARMMGEMAKAIGDTKAEERYASMAAKAVNLFRKKYLDEKGLVKDGWKTQCSYLYTLMLGLNPDEASRAETKKLLLKAIADNGDRLDTGFLGTAVILNVLSSIDATDVAYKLLLQHREPSWLYSVDQGATTMWERWNSYTKEKGFGNAGMNSFNHYAYGAVLDWMFNTMAGIRYNKAEPGYHNFVLAPKPNRALGELNGSYETPYGRVHSAWKYLPEGGCIFHAKIPANTTATVLIPCPNGEKVTVNGKAPEAVTPAEDSLSYIGRQDGCAAFKAVAGEFSAFVK